MSIGSPVVASLCAVPAALSVMVLPGFAVQAAWSAIAARRDVGRRSGVAGRNNEAQDPPLATRTHEPPAAALVAALALSVACVVGIGATMLALGLFSALRLGVVVGLAALVGVWPFLCWCWSMWRRLIGNAALIAVLAAPQAASIFGSGYRPAQSYQWFYWELGRQLSIAHGIPEHVMEWGSKVRWQPDYLSFNLLTQAYSGLLSFVSAPTAVAVWRLPLTLLVMALSFLTLRLWFEWLPAALATALLSASDLYIGKVGNNSPEALGLVVGLAAVWLAVSALRWRRIDWLLLGAVAAGLAVSVHGVAATVSGCLLVAGVLVELVATRPPLWRWLGLLSVGGVTCLFTLVALGLSLQGRATPLGDAQNPGLVGQVDPTYRFLQYSNGHFDAPVVHPGLVHLLSTPAARVNLLNASGAWLAGLLVVAVLGAAFIRAARVRGGVVTALVFATLLAAGVAWFELHYDTYVPRHTGNVRLAVYVAVVEAFGVAAGAQTLLHVVSLLPTPRLPPIAKGALGSLVVLGVVGLTAPQTVATMRSRPAISDAGARALALVRSTTPAGAVVIGNVATRGTIEYFTGREDPLEGRQPLIEEADTLTSAVDYLDRMHRFLRRPHVGEMRGSLGATWLVLCHDSNDLGSVLDYGRPALHFARKAGLETVWSEGGVEVLRVPGVRQSIHSVGPARSLGIRFLSVVAMGLLLALAVGAVVSRLSDRPDDGEHSPNLGRQRWAPDKMKTAPRGEHHA